MSSTTGTWYPPALGTGGFLFEGQLFTNPPFKMTDPIRAALERLIARLDETTDPNGPVPAWSDSYLAARAALSQPAPPAEGDAPAAWLYKGEPDFDGANWQENWCVTTNQQVAQFHAQPDSPVPLFRRLTLPKAPRKPDGYAYRYSHMGDSVIRFNGGSAVNGSRPTEAIPYWLGHPPLPIPPAEQEPQR